MRIRPCSTVLTLALPLAPCGCVAYHAQPLGAVPALPDRVAGLQVDTAALPFPQLAGHRFDPSDGLDEIEVATLAVANNPDLRLARDDAAVAHAQAFAAGLLPDPQLVLSGDMSNTSTGPDATRAFGLGVNYDINALVGRVAGVRSTRAQERKTSLALLWQEWQVVAQARLLFVKRVHGQRAIRLLEESRALASDRVRRTGAALAQGLVASDVALPALASLQDIDKQLYDARRQARQNARDLNALLGLAAYADVHLQEAGGAFPAPAAPAAALADLAQRRPDLLALEAGYAAQEVTYRAAILAQFPALNVGFTRVRDTSNIYSNGVGLTLSLPFLNRNRGAIAIEAATRQRLFDEYRQRVQAGRGDIDTLLAQRGADAARLAQVLADVAVFERALAHAGTAMRAGTVDALAYADARGALLARQIEQATLEQQIAEQNVALQTLLGVEPATPALNLSSPHGSR